VNRPPRAVTAPDLTSPSGAKSPGTGPLTAAGATDSPGDTEALELGDPVPPNSYEEVLSAASITDVRPPGRSASVIPATTSTERIAAREMGSHRRGRDAAVTRLVGRVSVLLQ
jgi:hypothetical protein